MHEAAGLPPLCGGLGNSQKLEGWRLSKQSGLSILRTVWLPLGLCEMSLFHCSYFLLCHVLFHELSCTLFLFLLFVGISFNHWGFFPSWTSSQLCLLYRLSCYLWLLLGLWGCLLDEVQLLEPEVCQWYWRTINWPAQIWLWTSSIF